MVQEFVTAFGEGFREAMHLARIVILLPFVAIVLLVYAMMGSVEHRPMSLRAVLDAARPHNPTC